MTLFELERSKNWNFRIQNLWWHYSYDQNGSNLL